MFAKRLVLLLVAFAVAMLTSTVSYANDAAILSHAYAWEQNMEVYIAGEMNFENLSRQVSNQADEVVDSGLLADKGVTKEEMFGEYSTVIFAGAGVVLIILVVVIIVLVIVRVKRKKRRGEAYEYTENGTLIYRTEIVGGENFANSLCVRFRNVSNPDQVWNPPLSTAIIIGRDMGCQICVHEKTVSRQQCRLYLANNVPIAENMSKTNITQLNCEPLRSPRPIKVGDKLTCGNVTLMVESLYSSNSGNLNKMTGFVNI